ncbi:MAG: 3'-5' exonuclease domain-containing protein 2 [Tannerella sp.]|jgi:ribonuclease D|nr:3'-5' exonuclease domain-containing protein 2 [Tannerella sp.]
MSYPETILKQVLSVLPVEIFTGEIVIVDTREAVGKAISYLSVFDHVGFDTETRPNFLKHHNHKVALIQLAAPHRCYLFRLNKLGGIPQALEDFLKNGKTVKVGLSLLDDFHNIRKLMDFKPDHFIDLQKVVPLYGIQETGLQKIYAILFGKKISKRMQLSNWEIDVLSDSQKQYAALDAWACLQIYKQLNQTT